MKIVFLVHDVDGIGGPVRTTLNSAAALAERHQKLFAVLAASRRSRRARWHGRYAMPNAVPAPGRPGAS